MNLTNIQEKATVRSLFLMIIWIFEALFLFIFSFVSLKFGLLFLAIMIFIAFIFWVIIMFFKNRKLEK
jgi:hypothetical protein